MMRSLVSILAMTGACVLAAPDSVPSAQAQGNCTAWTAQMEADEGGDVMVASACPEDEVSMPPLRLMCFDKVSIRYYPAPDGGPSAIPGDTARLTFEAGDQAIAMEMAYEDMDGAFAVYVRKDDPLTRMFRRNETVTVHAPGHTPRVVPLAGADAAIETLFQSCG